MTKKIILVVLLVLALVMTFVACEEVHQQHTFDTEWSSDATDHWHKATCCDTDEVSDKAPHSFSDVIVNSTVTCEVCGYSEHYVPNKPEPPHEHTYATEYSANEQCHWLATTCGHDVENAAPHGFVDGICATCGWWSSATDVLFANLSKSDVWSYTVLLDEVVLNDVRVYEETETVSLTVNGELKLSMSADGLIEGQGYFETAGLSLKAVISNGYVYACGEDMYYRSGLSDLLVQMGADVQEVEAVIAEMNANTQQIREVFEEARNAMQQLPIADVELQQLLAALLTVDEDKSNEQATVYVTDTAMLRQLNEMLATVTVEEYVNGALAVLNDTPLGVLLGNDFNELPTRVRTLLTQTIAQTITDLWKKQYTLDDLIKQLDKIIADYYPDEKVNTLDELLAALGVDLEGVTVKQMLVTVSMFSPEALWNRMQENDEDKISAAEIAETLTQICQAYGDKTIYEIALANNAELTAADVKALVTHAADLLDECVRVEFYIDNDGILQQVSIVVTESETEYEQPLNQLQQLLASFNGTITFKRGYASQQDYSKVVEQVEEYYNSLEASAAS